MSPSEWRILNVLWDERRRAVILKDRDPEQTNCDRAAKRCGVTPARVREINRRYQILRRKEQDERTQLRSQTRT